MKKLLTLIMLVAVCGLVYGAGIKTITIAETETTGTWVNTTGGDILLKTLFGTLAGVADNAETVSVSVSEDSVAYVVDSGTITSNLTVLAVDFDTLAYVSNSETVTVTRTSATTNEVLNLILIAE